MTKPAPSRSPRKACEQSAKAHAGAQLRTARERIELKASMERRFTQAIERPSPLLRAEREAHMISGEAVAPQLSVAIVVVAPERKSEAPR